MTSNTPRILVYDIETSPNVAYVWKTGYQITVTPESIIDERQIICICYKWLGEKKVYSLQWNPKGGKAKDKQLLKEFAKVYAQADATVAHNGDAFDTKWVRGRMLFHNLDPLPPLKQIDTLKECRRAFNLNSNKLDYISKLLGFEGKQKMSYSDWVSIMNGSMTALNKMVKYCKQDVVELENVYISTRKYFDNHGMAQAKQANKDVCPQCGNLDRQQKYGIYYTKSGAYQKYKCMSCTSIWRDSRQLKQQATNEKQRKHNIHSRILGKKKT